MFRFIKLLVACLFSFVLLAFLFSLSENTAFEEGDSYTFYCNSSSSEADIITVDEGAGLTKLFLKGVRGESTIYSDRDADSVIERYSAEVLFKEECDGVISYYCHSDMLGDGINLYGFNVNMHVAERQNSVCVGTPVIFGGY